MTEFIPRNLPHSKFYSNCLVSYLSVNNNLGMDDEEMLHRRARLRELVEVAFGGRTVDLLAHIKARTGKDANSGELSSLQKDHGPKSFGDKKARTLTAQIGLHRHWFSQPMGCNIDSKQWMLDASGRPEAKDIEELGEVIFRLTSSGKMTQSELDTMIAMLKAREGSE